MQCTDKGISLDKDELRALLEIASKEPTDRDKYGVQFAVGNDRCFARSTNGRIAVEADGEADGRHQAGEWFIHRDLLVAGKKLLTGKQVLRLGFTGASLNEVNVEENNVEISTLQWPSDAAIAQISFPWTKIALPPSNRDVSRCAAIAKDYLSTVQLVAEAAGVDFIDLYPPKGPDGDYIFRAGESGKTEWTGIIRPVQSQASVADSQGAEKAPTKRNGKQTEAFADA